MTTNNDKPTTQPLPALTAKPLRIKPRRGLGKLGPRGMIAFRILLVLATIALIVLDAIFHIFAPISDWYATVWADIIRKLVALGEALTPNGTGW